MKIIQKNCKREDAKNKSLPRNSYIVLYEDEGESKYDIVQSNSSVEIFDHYYDNYRNVKEISWTDGNVNPKVYGAEKPNKKKK